MNEYLTLYAIGDFLAYHFISNDKAKLDEQGNIVFIKNPDNFKEPEKKIYNILITTHQIISQLSNYAIDILKNKYQNILNGFYNNVYFKNGFMPVFVGLSILEHYSSYKGEKIYKIQPKIVRKTIEKIQKEVNISTLDESFLNSFIIGEKFFKKINPNLEKKCS